MKTKPGVVLTLVNEAILSEGAARASGVVEANRPFCFS
jgi:hypothetical protein